MNMVFKKKIYKLLEEVSNEYAFGNKYEDGYQSAIEDFSDKVVDFF